MHPVASSVAREFQARRRIPYCPAPQWQQQITRGAPAEPPRSANQHLALSKNSPRSAQARD
jgi:hypothetical protein